MSVIAAARIGKEAWICCDGRSNMGDMLVCDDSNKIMVSPDRKWAIGLAGLTVVQQLLKRQQEKLWVDIPDGTDGILTIIDHFRQILQDSNADPHSDIANFCPLRDYGISPIILGENIGPVIACSTLYGFTPAIGEYFAAIGVAREYAMGVMEGLYHHSAAIPEVSRLVKAAVTRSCVRYAPSCGGNITLVKIGVGNGI